MKELFDPPHRHIRPFGDLSPGDLFFEGDISLKIHKDHYFRKIPPITLPDGQIRNATWEPTQGWRFFPPEQEVTFCGKSSFLVDQVREKKRKTKRTSGDFTDASDDDG